MFREHYKNGEPWEVKVIYNNGTPEGRMGEWMGNVKMD